MTLLFWNCKKIIFVAFLAALSIELSGQKFVVSSPDSSIRVNVFPGQRLTYDVILDGNPVLKNSVIDLQLSNNISLSRGGGVKYSRKRSVAEIIEAQIPVSRKFIPNNFNELHIFFRNGFSVVFRAYNDGVAYRIISYFKDSLFIKNEIAQFNFLSGTIAWAPLVHKRTDQDIFHTSFEELYPKLPIDSISRDNFMYSPVLLNSSGNIKVCISESDLDDYPGLFLKGTGSHSLMATFAAYPEEEQVIGDAYPQMIVRRRADYLAKTKGSRSFPWRVLLIAKQDKDLPTNDLVYRLASPSKIKDISWIHPGKCTDEWIIDINLFNVPFKSGINTATYKYYIDFAKKFGFNRIMMDAGWSNVNNLFDINPNLNMDSLSAYARQKGIKLSLWTLAMTLDRQLDSALKQFQKWGVDFIMTDFIDRDDQKAVNFHHRITQACANARLMIMFHGSYPPKGFNRTYPNCLTKEAVLGSEYNAWSNLVTSTHNCTIPFTRMTAGPLDYEPGILDNATTNQFRPIWGKVMSQTTRSHQLALFVVYDNPLQVFSGNPSRGLMEPAFMHLLGSVPTTWDTTIVLDAKVGQFIVTARKYKDSWFIAGITDTVSRSFNFNLSFLNPGKYKVTICADGVNANRNAEDYLISESVQDSKNSIVLQMAKNGGFLARIEKEN